jgi:MiaB-like tRNA modifying enzyme
MKAYLDVFGCTANKSDASIVRGILRENKFEIVKKINDADFLIIHTCTVINTTEQRMLSRLRMYKKTGKKVIVTGCMASIQPDLIKETLPEAKLLPARYPYQILNLIESKKIKYHEKNKTRHPRSYGEIIAPISIAEGCLFSCSYCITSQARGRLKSYPKNDIVTDVSNAVNQGCKEIQITAQDVSSYGLDTGNNLGELLVNIAAIQGDFRVRVGMMNPHTCLRNTKSIIKGYQDNKIYKFLHLPVQSGDDDILKLMDRIYSVKDFFYLVDKFRGKYDDITISTDVIVGFPTETDEQFNNTVRLIEKLKPDITNITRFSARPYTKAKTMKGRINTDILKKRSKELSDVCKKLSRENNFGHIGKKYRVLITEKGKGNTYIGRSENYKPVVINKQVKVGEFCSVEIIDYATTYVVGSII